MSRPRRCTDDRVQATRLRFDPGSTRCRRSAGADSSYVEAFWSRSLSAILEKCPGKSQRMYSSAYSSAARRGVFLSQAGPRFDSVLLQAGHHPLVWFGFASETTKATLLDRPRVGCYAARELACAPPIEGRVVAAKARDEHGRIARPLRRHLRVGEERVGKWVHQHDGSCRSRSDLSQNCDRTSRVNFEKSRKKSTP